MGEREGGRGGERSGVHEGGAGEGRTSSSARGLLASAAANEPRSLTRCARDAGIVPALVRVARVSVRARVCVQAFGHSCTRVRAYMQALPLCVGCTCAARMRARCAERTGTPNHVELFEESEHLLPAQPRASAENTNQTNDCLVQFSTARCRVEGQCGVLWSAPKALRPQRARRSALDCCSDARCCHRHAGLSRIVQEDSDAQRRKWEPLILKSPYDRE